ncbi:hypothetical protein ACFLU6_14680 [Acidobacteriota bacterium]
MEGFKDIFRRAKERIATTTPTQSVISDDEEAEEELEDEFDEVG